MSSSRRIKRGRMSTRHSSTTALRRGGFHVITDYMTSNIVRKSDGKVRGGKEYVDNGGGCNYYISAGWFV